MRYRGMSERASLSAAGHEGGEPLEQMIRVVRTRRGLRMVLDGKRRQLAMTQSLARAVVEIDMGRHPARTLHRFRFHREAVILRGDLHLAGHEILYRMVRAVMPEGQLVRPATRSEAEDLVAQTDAKDGDSAQQAAHRLGEIGNCLGIARAVREEHPVRLLL